MHIFVAAYFSWIAFASFLHSLLGVLSFKCVNYHKWLDRWAFSSWCSLVWFCQPVSILDTFTSLFAIDVTITCCKRSNYSFAVSTSWFLMASSIFKKFTVSTRKFKFQESSRFNEKRILSRVYPVWIPCQTHQDLKKIYTKWLRSMNYQICD